nr:hypothetical protein [uncultured Acetatifactor sp.]
MVRFTLSGIIFPGIHAFIVCKTVVLSRLVLFRLLDFLSKSFLLRLHTLFRLPFPARTMPRLPDAGIPRLIGSIAATCKGIMRSCMELCICFFTVGGILFSLPFLFCH